MRGGRPVFGPKCSLRGPKVFSLLPNVFSFRRDVFTLAARCSVFGGARPPHVPIRLAHDGPRGTRGLRGCVNSVGPMCPVLGLMCPVFAPMCQLFGRMCPVSGAMCPLWRGRCPVLGGGALVGNRARTEGEIPPWASSGKASTSSGQALGSGALWSERQPRRHVLGEDGEWGSSEK